MNTKAKINEIENKHIIEKNKFKTNFFIKLTKTVNSKNNLS